MANKDWCSMTPQERKDFNLASICWKSESHNKGPIWAKSHHTRFCEFMEEEVSIMVNFRNSPLKDTDGNYFAAWCYYHEAEDIAKKLNVELEEF